MSKKRIKRMSKYKSALLRFQETGIERVLSKNIAEAVGEKDTQVRKDFSFFSITGKKKFGYVVDELLDEIHHILRKDQTLNLVIVGAGYIGKALMNYSGFGDESIKVVACFDTDPEKYDENAEVPILPMDKLDEVIKEQNIQYGVIAVPDVAAQRVLDLMVNAGIKGFLNFAPLRLKVPKDVVFNSVDIAMEIENLSYFTKLKLEEKK